MTQCILNGLIYTCLREEEYDEIVEQSVAKKLAAFDAFNKTGSGWILERVEKTHYEDIQI